MHRAAKEVELGPEFVFEEASVRFAYILRKVAEESE